MVSRKACWMAASALAGTHLGFLNTSRSARADGPSRAAGRRGRRPPRPARTRPWPSGAPRRRSSPTGQPADRPTDARPAPYSSGSPYRPGRVHGRGCGARPPCSRQGTAPPRSGPASSRRRATAALQPPVHRAVELAPHQRQDMRPVRRRQNQPCHLQRESRKPALANPKKDSFRVAVYYPSASSCRVSSM